MIVNKLKGVRYMLDFVYNRNKITEVMAEDALATMELLEKVKADTKPLGSFAGDGLLIPPPATSYVINKALAVLNMDQKDLIKNADGLDSVSNSAKEVKESIRLITTDSDDVALVSEEVFVVIFDYLTDAVQSFAESLEDFGQENNKEE